MKLKVLLTHGEPAIHLNIADMEKLGLKPGTGGTLDLQRSSHHGWILGSLPARPRFCLAELVRQCDLFAPDSPETASWLHLSPVGRELD